jgi:AAA+ ATPase superfamily predicted ATPase
MPTRWPRRFAAEGATVGRLLSGYVNLEIGLMNCVQMGRNGDLDTVLRKMFGTRGESKRITEATKLGGSAYSHLGLQRDFDRAIAALRHCLNIRNQYAHWIWWDDSTSRLAFANLEQLAKQKRRIVDLRRLRAYHVGAALLMEQERYFAYTDQVLAWVNYEGRKRAGRLQRNPVRKPRRLRKPKLRQA